MCWDYRLWEEGWTVVHHYCTNPDEPVAPTYPVFHYFGCCPGVPYPDRMATTSLNHTPGGCDCLNLSFLELVWNAGIGIWGGWRATNTSCPGAGITLTVEPIACIAGGMRWKLTLSWPGGFRISIQDVPCGHGMTFAGIGVDAPGCVAAVIDVFVSWPGSL